MSEIEETAKATQEVAKTTSNALDKAEKLGGFITKYFGTTLEQSIGIFNDKLKYWRWDNQVNLISKANKKMENLGLNYPPKQIPLKFGLPLLEAASLEDDSKLQDLWANLLVNSSINNDFTLERSYISILEQLSSLEAQIIIQIYSNFTYKINNMYEINALYLPEYIQIKQHKTVNHKTEEIILFDTLSKIKNKEMSSEVHLSLTNLARLQCIEGTPTHGAGTFYGRINPTLFGAKLYEAVREPKFK